MMTFSALRKILRTGGMVVAIAVLVIGWLLNAPILTVALLAWAGYVFGPYIIIISCWTVGYIIGSIIK